jgi:hypothetical protein
VVALVIAVPLPLRAARWVALVYACFTALWVSALVFGIGDRSAVYEALPDNAALGTTVTLQAVLAILLFAIWRGLSRQRPWVRPVILVYFFASQLVDLLTGYLLARGHGGQLSISLVPAICLIGAAIYLYAVPSVTAYFRSLNTVRAGAA